MKLRILGGVIIALSPFVGHLYWRAFRYLGWTQGPDVLAAGLLGTGAFVLGSWFIFVGGKAGK